MSNEPIKSSRRVLDPMDRVSEVLFGLILVLTFTGSLSVAQSGRTEIRTMLLGALGCLVAQRTQAYESDRDVQRGFLFGFSCKLVELTTYVFNPNKDKPPPSWPLA